MKHLSVTILMLLCLISSSVYGGWYWSSTDSMTTTRSLHSAVLLGNGNMLTSGGYNGSYLSSSELYNPGTGKWSSTGNMKVARSEHTTTLLGNGKVLAVGGYNGAYLSSCELYNAGSWVLTDSMSVKRRYHSATLLQDGRVLICGGYNGSQYLSSCEIYDPVADTFSVVSSMGTKRANHTATLLANGNVLVVGGYNGSELTSCEVYNPTTDTWTSAGNVSIPRSFHTATLLDNGKVLVVGGKNANSKTAEIYNAGVWSTTGALQFSVYSHTATKLQNGQVLIAGGRESVGNNYAMFCNIYNPSTDLFENTKNFQYPKAYYTASLLNNGKVLVAGGNDSTKYFKHCELFNSDTTPPVVNLIAPDGYGTLKADTTYNIKWTASDNNGISYISLEYMSKGKAGWNFIASLDGTTTNYLWNVPSSIVKDSIKVKVTVYDLGDNSSSDSTSGYYYVVGSTTARIIKPNGGEVFGALTYQDIEWVASSYCGVKSVVLYYSTNNGTTITKIDSITSNVTKYSWKLPEANSNKCFVRITVYDSLGGSKSDRSDSLFTISSIPIVKVLFPNGGEKLAGNSTQEIRWQAIDSTGIRATYLYYSTNNGTNWSLIDSLKTNKTSYLWKIPNVYSTKSLVKITVYDLLGYFATDVSDTTFTIKDGSAPTVTVLTPAGGEKFAIGSQQIIKWTATDNVGVSAVSVYYQQFENVWIKIDSLTTNLTNPDSVLWTIPNTPTREGKVRVYAYDADGNKGWDDSEVFSILADVDDPVVSVTSPNGGEIWAPGSSQTIKYTATDNKGVVKTSFYYTLDGIKYTKIDSVNGNPGTFNWTLPRRVSDKAKVKVCAYDATGNMGFDVSDTYFSIKDTISPVVVVTSPNGGEDFSAGSSQQIKYQTFDNVGIMKVSAYYTLDGTTFVKIDSLSSNPGAIDWTVPLVVSSTVKVKVCVYDSAGNKGVDLSDKNFTISDKVLPTVLVTSPNGGENWKAGSTKKITYTASDNVGIKKSIFHYTTDGTNYTRIDSVNGNPGTYNWKVPNIASTTVKVRVTTFDLGGNTAVDVSNANFTISDSTAPTVTVKSPNGKEVWGSGTLQVITYTASDNVGVAKAVAYYTTDGTNYIKADSVIGNPGKIEWVVTETVTTKAKVKVYVYDASGNFATDTSDSAFTIIDKSGPVVKVLSPNGGEVWTKGVSKSITYTATDNVQVSKVSAYYTTDGINYVKIDSASSNPGTFNWTPQILSPSVKVRIYAYDSSNNKSYDASDTDFMITDTTVVLIDNFEGGAFPPTGWTIVDSGASSNNKWNTYINPYKVSTVARVNWKPREKQDERLITKSFDCRKLTKPTLKFWQNYQNYEADDTDTGYVHISVDGGTTWQFLTKFTKDTQGEGEIITLNITPYAAGKSNVKVRFRYVGEYDMYWEIDDIMVYNASVSVALVSLFEATPVEEKIIVRWQTELENDNTGFNIYRSTNENEMGTKLNSELIKDYSYTDNEVENGKKYYYTLGAVNTSGYEEFFGPVSIVRNNFIPLEFALRQNYPNPFNPVTVISYQLPVNSGRLAVSSKTTDYRLPVTNYQVKLSIYNITGQLVRTLVNEQQSAGYYNVKWDGKDDNGMDVPSGLYLYQLKAGDLSAIRKMMLLK